MNKVFRDTVFLLVISIFLITACSIASTPTTQSTPTPIPTPTLITGPFDLVLIEAQNLEYIRREEIVPPAPYSATVYAEVPWEFTPITTDTHDFNECPDWTESERIYVRFAGESIIEAELTEEGIHIFSQVYGELGVVPEGSIWTIEREHESIVYLNCQNRFFFMWYYQP